MFSACAHGPVARLPRGVAFIRDHIREVDNVPLLVPLFADVTPETTIEMVFLSLPSPIPGILLILSLDSHSAGERRGRLLYWLRAQRLQHASLHSGGYSLTKALYRDLSLFLLLHALFVHVLRDGNIRMQISRLRLSRAFPTAAMTRRQKERRCGLAHELAKKLLLDDPSD